MNDDGETLDLRREVGGFRHYLAEEPIHAGDILEFRLDDGKWQFGRYEWTFQEQDEPFLFVSEDSALSLLRPDMRLRWPAAVSPFQRSNFIRLEQKPQSPMADKEVYRAMCARNSS